MTSVIIIQALLFQDGGIDALGANVFNMCILGCLVSEAIIARFRNSGGTLFSVSVAFAAWCSVVAGAIACSVELAFSGTSPLVVVMPAMGIIHAVIGVFEGIITVVSMRFILALHPGLTNIAPEYTK